MGGVFSCPLYPVYADRFQAFPARTAGSAREWDSGTDPKQAALAEVRCLDPHAQQVTDPEFLPSQFFDARDAVQVKYEMVRKVKAGGGPVTEASAAFGYSGRVLDARYEHLRHVALHARSSRRPSR
jgi:hypothetical protein